MQKMSFTLLSSTTQAESEGKAVTAEVKGSCYLRAQLYCKPNQLLFCCTVSAELLSALRVTQPVGIHVKSHLRAVLGPV